MTKIEQSSEGWKENIKILQFFPIVIKFRVAGSGFVYNKSTDPDPGEPTIYGANRIRIQNTASDTQNADLMPTSLQALGHTQRVLHVIEAGAEAEVLAEPQHQLHDATVGLDVRLEDVVLGHLALPVPGAPLRRLAELQRVDALLHLLQPLPQASHLTSKTVIHTETKAWQNV